MLISHECAADDTAVRARGGSDRDGFDARIAKDLVKRRDHPCADAIGSDPNTSLGRGVADVGENAKIMEVSNDVPSPVTCADAGDHEITGKSILDAVAGLSLD